MEYDIEMIVADTTRLSRLRTSEKEIVTEVLFDLNIPFITKEFYNNLVDVSTKTKVQMREDLNE